MRTNSPMDDPIPFEVPQFETLEDDPIRPKANSINRQQVDEYIKKRIDYFDKYLPNGTPVLDTAPDELGRWWTMAATLKAEFEALNAMIQAGAQEEKPEDVGTTTGV